MTTTPRGVLESRMRTVAKAAGETDSDSDTDAVEPLRDAEDADAIRAFVSAYRSDNLLATPPEGESTLDPGTLATYIARLTEAARQFVLKEATAADVNSYLDGRQANDSPWTTHGYAVALRKFYHFHDFGPAADEITMPDTPTGSSFDPDDVLTRQEIHDLLDATDNARDRAVIALLVYTGARNAAVRYLRIGDVDTQEGTSGTWTVPDEVDGLKGLGKYGNRRPLLGARGPVREWLKYHPASDDPDAYLITGRPKYGKANPSEPVAGSTIRRVQERAVENAENPALERKPTNPHMMRHTFVTVCKRDYGMDDATVKFLIGHAPGSRVMETTYAHLSDDDHIRDAEEAAGMREPAEDESPLTPPACPTCGEPLPAEARACHCGHVFGPDVHSIEEAAETLNDEAADLAFDTTDPEINRLARLIHESTEDPDALRRELIDQLPKE